MQRPSYCSQLAFSFTRTLNFQMANLITLRRDLVALQPDLKQLDTILLVDFAETVFFDELSNISTLAVRSEAHD